MICSQRPILNEEREEDEEGRTDYEINFPLSVFVPEASRRPNKRKIKRNSAHTKRKYNNWHFKRENTWKRQGLFRMFRDYYRREGGVENNAFILSTTVRSN